MKRIKKLGLFLFIAVLVFLPGVSVAKDGGAVALEILYTSDMNGNIFPCSA